MNWKYLTKNYFHIIFYLSVALVIYLSVIPHSGMIFLVTESIEFLHFDWLGMHLHLFHVHIITYLYFGIILGLYLRRSKIIAFQQHSYLYAFIIAFFIGFILEALQGNVIGRESDFVDVLNNAYGLVIATIARWLVEKHSSNKLIKNKEVQI